MADKSVVDCVLCFAHILGWAYCAFNEVDHVLCFAVDGVSDGICGVCDVAGERVGGFHVRADSAWVLAGSGCVGC